MAATTKGIFIVGAKRTPFGKMGGIFAKTSHTELSVIASTAAIQSANVKPEKIDSVIFGNVMSATSSDGIYLPRHVLLKCGIPLEKPAYAVNRLCGSGFQSVVNGIQSILTGESKIVLAGGAENMSQCPFAVRNIRYGTTIGQKYEFEDTLWAGLVDTYCQLPMGLTAEKLGAKYSVTRDEADQYSLRSQKLWKEAHDAGRFKAEIAPVPLKIKNKDVVVEVDEHPRQNAKIEDFSKLKSVFQKDGLVTAGTASGISDGAGAIILASEEAIKSEGLTPLARIIGFSVVGVDPSIMGIGPVSAIRNLLKVTGKSIDDIELVEINEAFAAQTLSCIKDLKLDINKVNVDGGAIALGHPLAASGSRITAHLTHELRRRKAGSLGIGSACIGGGQGIAVLIESL
ncbi:3-ketoacyl-CoA thiolase, mitochondrial [Orussus abietinus]|uniref:3-ketoacyl-CoA thiolase, mitochondrial n=1 Tax=Orussus abietinus TaxID=222816 RepID=UPI0006262F61|nr:3-ketoacyl-CoA thiolase, mitochondrial [Orussus abietinus]XP_012284920.1 3-ketoacyl-CoA thiolase, mitochondrial [Orussus abietinus]